MKLVNWSGLMIVEEFKHIRNGEVIYEEYEIKNQLHLEGQQLILGAMFSGGPTANPFIPDLYYFGLDNRSIVAVDDTLATIGSLEPRQNGYARQPVSSTSGFTIEFNNDRAAYQATGQIVTFRGTGGSPNAVVWGPVQNLFLTDRPIGADIGTLIATATLSTAVSVRSGDSISMRMSMVIKASASS